MNDKNGSKASVNYASVNR